MKTLQELRIEIIRPTHKEGDDAIKKAIYDANDIIFPCSKRPISKCATVRIATALKDILSTLKDHEPTDRVKPKYREVVSILDEHIKKLRIYYKDIRHVNEDITQATRVLNYQVSQYLKKKDEILNGNTEDILKTLQANKSTYEDYACIDGVKLPDSYIKMQKELLNILNNKYEIYNN